MQPAKDRRKRVKLMVAGGGLVIIVLVLVVFGGGRVLTAPGSTMSASTANGSLMASATMASTQTASATTTTEGVAAAVVYGQVLGEEGNSAMYTVPIPGAVVTVTNAPNSTVIATAVSNSNGHYSLSIPSPIGQPLTAQPYIIRVHQSNWNNDTPASMLIYLFWGYGASSNFKNDMYLTNPSSTTVTSSQSSLSTVEANITVTGQAAEIPCEALRLPCPSPTIASAISATLIMYGGTYYYVSYMNVNTPTSSTRYVIWYNNSTYYCVTPQVEWANACPTT
jgi:hypothetical protein